MTTLLFGFCGEGSTDYRFIMRVTERVLEKILPHADIFSLPIETQEGASSQSEKIMYAAEHSNGYGLLIFHLDADDSDTRDAFEKRFRPGFELVIERETGVNKDIVPLIPVRMTEAWMLVDFEAFSRTVGTKKDAKELNFPAHPHQVENIQNPKSVFETAVRHARPGKRRQIKPVEIYTLLASNISLDLLAKVPAYQEFENRLLETLIRLHYKEE